MKKITFSFLLTLFVLSSAVFLFAKEEAPLPQAAFVPAGAETPVSLPFEFSLSQGKWTQGRPGQIFSTGTHAPDFTLPSLKEDPAPIRYPRWAVQEGWEGTLSIAIEVKTDGTVGRWMIMKSTGYPLLDEAAAAAVRQWQFHPATEQGKAILMCVQIPILFELKD
ncbi:MAG: energy transducer TonB [Candidatus Omnitrophica bacterium]|nr:energy transducer TonB [Candidatus Omnitrophota bacterium]